MTIPRTEPRPRTACGGLIKDDPARYPSAAYGGQTIYFCLRACRRVFEQNPDGFMAGQVAHPSEEEASEIGRDNAPAQTLIR